MSLSQTTPLPEAEHLSFPFRYFFGAITVCQVQTPYGALPLEYAGTYSKSEKKRFSPNWLTQWAAVTTTPRLMSDAEQT